MSLRPLSAPATRRQLHQPTPQLPDQQQQQQQLKGLLRGRSARGRDNSCILPAEVQPSGRRGFAGGSAGLDIASASFRTASASRGERTAAESDHEPVGPSNQA